MKYEDLPKLYEIDLVGQEMLKKRYAIGDKVYDCILVKHQLTEDESKLIESVLELEPNSVFQLYTQYDHIPVAFLVLYEVRRVPLKNMEIPANVVYVFTELRAKRHDVYAAHYKNSSEFNVKACIASQRYDLHTAKFTDDDEIYAIWVKKPSYN